MSDDLKRTVRIRRLPKVALDERGHTVWTGEVDSGEFELVSTVMLEQILESDEARDSIREAAAGKDGYLAKSADSNTFEIIDDEDVQAALASASDAPDAVRPADVILDPLGEPEEDEEELSLVSTQMLKQLLSGDDPEPEEPQDEGGGFDPYDHS